MKKLSPRRILLLFLGSLLLTLGFQLLGLWTEGTPLRFDAITLVVLPAVFFAVVLLYIVGIPKLLDRLAGKSATWTPFRRRWVEIALLFMMLFFYTDLSDALLGEASFSLVDQLINIVLAPLAGLLGAWVDRTNGVTPELAEGV